jgi:hypothetical protein
MLATSTRLLAAPLNQHTSAEWFRTFGDEEAAPQQLKVLKEETLGALELGETLGVENQGKLVNLSIVSMVKCRLPGLIGRRCLRKSNRC